MLCGRRAPSRCVRYRRWVTGKEPAPQPSIGWSDHAPAASDHHTHRWPALVEARRAGSTRPGSCWGERKSSQACETVPVRPRSDVAIAAIPTSTATSTAPPRTRPMSRDRAGLGAVRASMPITTRPTTTSAAIEAASTRPRTTPSPSRAERATKFPVRSSLLRPIARAGAHAASASAE